MRRGWRCVAGLRSARLWRRRARAGGISCSRSLAGLELSRVHPAVRSKAEEVFPQAKANLRRPIRAGMKIACGTGAPAIAHGHNAKGAVGAGGSRYAAARITPVRLAALIAGDPLRGIEVRQDFRFEMKGGRIIQGTDLAGG